MITFLVDNFGHVANMALPRGVKQNNEDAQ